MSSLAKKLTLIGCESLGYRLSLIDDIVDIQKVYAEFRDNFEKAYGVDNIQCTDKDNITMNLYVCVLLYMYKYEKPCMENIMKIVECKRLLYLTNEEKFKDILRNVNNSDIIMIELLLVMKNSLEHRKQRGFESTQDSMTMIYSELNSSGLFGYRFSACGITYNGSRIIEAEFFDNMKIDRGKIYKNGNSEGFYIVTDDRVLNRWLELFRHSVAVEVFKKHGYYEIAKYMSNLKYVMNVDDFCKKYTKEINNILRRMRIEKEQLRYIGLLIPEYDKKYEHKWNKLVYRCENKLRLLVEIQFTYYIENNSMSYKIEKEESLSLEDILRVIKVEGKVIDTYEEIAYNLIERLENGTEDFGEDREYFEIIVKMIQGDMSGFENSAKLRDLSLIEKVYKLYNAIDRHKYL